MLFQGPFYNPATAYLVRDGRFYWCFDTGRDTTYVVAGDLSRSLTDRASWRISDGLPIPRIPASLTRCKALGKILEGNIVADPRAVLQLRCAQLAAGGLYHRLATDATGIQLLRSSHRRK